ncbi:MAG: hypothetical protein D6725_08345, partial [Planctomycetota bacterium]
MPPPEAIETSGSLRCASPPRSAGRPLRRSASAADFACGPPSAESEHAERHQRLHHRRHGGRRSFGLFRFVRWRHQRRRFRRRLDRCTARGRRGQHRSRGSICG